MAEYTTTVRELEKNINKAFDSFSGKVSVPCSEFLRELDMTPINSLIFGTYREEWRYRHSPTFMLKATAFMKLRGIKHQVGLMKHLQKNERDARNLGCQREQKSGKFNLPARRSFNHFMNERLTREIHGLIGFVVQYSRETAIRRGILLDFVDITVPKKGASDRTLFRRKREKSRELCRAMRKSMYPMIEMEHSHNSVFKRNDFLDMLTHTALTHDFTENGSHTFAYQKGGRTPDADTLLYHLKKFRHRRQLEEMFGDMFTKSIEMAKRAGFANRPLDLAIDITETLYYGDTEDYMVIGTKPRAGTMYSFKFATVNAVLNGERLFLYAIPVAPKGNIPEIVSKLMEFVKGKVRIKRVYLDRGFYSAGVIDYFNRNSIQFIMPAKRTWRVKKIMEKNYTPYITDFKMKWEWTRATTWHKLVVVYGQKRGNKNEKYAFATNIDIKRKNASLLLAYYDRRWGIETSYRVKEAFRARTTSKNYIIRLFYYMFSLTLYNLWVLVNSMLSIFLFGDLPEKPILTARLFGAMLYTVDGV